MLELDNGQKLMDDLWKATSAKVELSDSMKQELFDTGGASRFGYDNRRSYQRYFMRGKAVLKRDDTMLGTYTKDVSRQGVGFLSPVSLLPKERVKLRMSAAELSLEITRCQRLDAKCFECGAKFVL
jgi:PilZ domain